MVERKRGASYCVTVVVCHWLAKTFQSSDDWKGRKNTTFQCCARKTDCYYCVFRLGVVMEGKFSTKKNFSHGAFIVFVLCVWMCVSVCAPLTAQSNSTFFAMLWVLLQHFHFTEVSEPHHHHHHNSVPAERFLIVLLLLFSFTLLFHAHHIVRMWNINTFSLGAVWL